MRKLAEHVEVGDTILLWTATGTPRRVSEIRPYVGTLAEPSDNWRSAAFSTGGGITLIPGQEVEVA